MITGFFDPAQPPHPYVNVAVYIEGITSPDGWPLIPFLVDTGAAQTTIHPKDAVRRLGLTIAQLTTPSLWPDIVGSHGVGGPANTFRKVAAYAFQDDAGIWRATPIGQVCIAELTPANQTIPSLLGWDVLRYFRLEVHGNPEIVSLHWL